MACTCSRTAGAISNVCDFCIQGMPTASFTKRCETHGTFFSSDLSCPSCPTTAERLAAFTSIDHADRHQVSEAFDSIWDKKSSAEIQAALDEEPSPELETAAKPTRYNKTGTTLEVWDAIEQLGLDYKQGNVLKYTYRYKDKKGPEDLCKAINYIIKMLSQETGIDYYELHKLTPEQLAKRVKK